MGQSSRMEWSKSSSIGESSGICRLVRRSGFVGLRLESSFISFSRLVLRLGKTGADVVVGHSRVESDSLDRDPRASRTKAE